MISSKNMQPVKERIVQATVRKLDVKDNMMIFNSWQVPFGARLDWMLENKDLVISEKHW